MPVPRHIQIDVDQTRYYHCVSRCVRRAFLCGVDQVSGRDFNHRRQWLIERLMELSAVFAIDVCNHSAMSNHFHITVRIDRQRAVGWSDAEVAKRYARVFRSAAGTLSGLTERQRARQIAQWRGRLWDLSWFMRCLNERIARRANKEDGCSGRFWEGRFRCQALLDHGALLACMAYVDLNPMRAGIADSLEGSHFTSIRERLRRRRAGTSSTGGWRPGQLVPFSDEVSKEDRAAEPSPQPLPVEFGDYEALLRETGEAIRQGRYGEELSEAATRALGSVGVNAAAFIPCLRDFSRSFFSMVGEVHRIDAECTRRGYRRRTGIPAARKLYLAA